MSYMSLYDSWESLLIECCLPKMANNEKLETGIKKWLKYWNMLLIENPVF